MIVVFPDHTHLLFLPSAPDGLNFFLTTLSVLNASGYIFLDYSMAEWFCITLLMLEMLKQSLNFISAFCARKYSAVKFSKSTTVKISNFFLFLI